MTILFPGFNRKTFTDWSLLVLALLLSRVLYVSIVGAESYSIDMHRWGAIASELMHGRNPYNTLEWLNAAPFWMQILFTLGKFSVATGVSFYTCVRSLLVVVDIVIVSVLYWYLRSVLRYASARTLLLLAYALNPVCIILTMQHGQFDSIIGLWILLAVICFISFSRTGDSIDWLWSCSWIGIGILSKTVPFVLLPLAAHRLRDIRIKIVVLGVLLALLPVLIGMSVIYALGPDTVTRNVIQYKSIPKYFGVTGLLYLITGSDALVQLYVQLFVVLLFCSLAYVAVYVHRAQQLSEYHIVLISLLVLLLLPTLGSGYGPQYASWFIPLLLLLFCYDPNTWKRPLFVLYVIGAVTYICEYAILPTHGAFLVRHFRITNLIPIQDALVHPNAQTTVRLPLFLCLAYMMVKMLQELRLAESFGARTQE